MLRKPVSSGGNSNLAALQKQLAPHLKSVFLSHGAPQRDGSHLKNAMHNELFKDMNRLNGCFMDITDAVCAYKVELGTTLQKLIESYNSVFLQQYEVFYEGRLEKEKMLDAEVLLYQRKQQETLNEKDVLLTKQGLAEEAI